MIKMIVFTLTQDVAREIIEITIYLLISVFIYGVTHNIKKYKT